MARKNAAGGGAAKPAKKRDAVASPPLNQEEFETAFRAYCAEKGECSSQSEEYIRHSLAAPDTPQSYTHSLFARYSAIATLHQRLRTPILRPAPGPPDSTTSLEWGDRRCMSGPLPHPLAAHTLAACFIYCRVEWS